MAINKKLIHFNTKTNFDALSKATSNSDTSKDILYNSICFIKDTNLIWTHGSLYNCNSLVKDIKVTNGWNRIGELNGRRNSALIRISNKSGSSLCSSILLYIHSYNNSLVVISLLGGSIGTLFKRARVVYKGSDLNTVEYIELECNTSNLDYIDITSYESGDSVKIYMEHTAGSIPSGYTQFTLNLKNGINIYGNIEGTNVVATQLGTTLIGSNVLPIYLNTNGKPVATTYKLEKSVPSNAVFTDTTYSTATTTNNGLMSSGMVTLLNKLSDIYFAGYYQSNDYPSDTGLLVDYNLEGVTLKMPVCNLESGLSIEDTTMHYTIDNATSTYPGVMSAEDKQKLDATHNAAISTVDLTTTATNASLKINLLKDAAITTTIPAASTTAAGLMTSTDKTKLNGIANGAEVNLNAFSNVKIDTTTISADTKTDTLTLNAGSNIILSPNASNDGITIASESPVNSISGTYTIGEDNTSTRWRIAKINSYIGTGLISIINDYTGKAPSSMLLFVLAGHYYFNSNNIIQCVAGLPSPNFALAYLVYPNSLSNTSQPRYIDITVAGKCKIFVYITNNHNMTLMMPQKVTVPPTGYTQKMINLEDELHKIPDPPTTGTATLKSVEGTLIWE